DKVLGEFELNLSGASDPTAAAKIGNLTGAEVLVTGRVFQAGDEMFLASKVISVATGRVFGDLAEFKKGQSIGDATTVLSAKVSNRITGNRSAFVAPAETPEARLARLSALVAGKTLPSVYVAIP